MRPWILLWWCLLMPVPGSLAAAEDPGRAALREQAPPWYDAGADDWKRIAAKAPEAETHAGSRSGGLGEVFGWLMIAVVVVVTALLLWQLLRNLRLDTSLPVEERRRVAVARAVADLSALPFAEAGMQDPEAALAQARAAHDWRRAVAWSYALHLVELDHAGVLRLARGTTNRGYQRTLVEWAQAGAQRADLPALLAEAIATFERTWFGHQPADDRLVQRLEQGRERLRIVLRQEPGAET